MSRPLAFGVLVIALAGAGAALLALAAVPVPEPAPLLLRRPQVQPATQPPPVPPQAPIERLEDAVRARHWGEATALAKELSDAGPPDGRLKLLLDRIRRGAQRDTAGIVESASLRGTLSTLEPGDEKPSRLGQLAPDKPFTIPAKRSVDLLVFSPNKEIDAAELAEEMRVLRIEGLEMELKAKPKPREVAPSLAGLAALPLRYLGGSVVDRVPPEVIAASPRIEVVDLQARQEGLGAVLAALAGRPMLRRLRLPDRPGLDAAGLAALATLIGLQDLELRGDGLDDAAWSGLGTLPALRRLRISGAPPAPGLATALAAGSPQLEELSCDGSRLTAPALAALGNLPRLRTLRFAIALPAPAVAALGSLANLQRLSFAIEERAGVPDLTALTALSELGDLSLGVKAPGSGLRDVSGLEAAQATRLELQFGGVDDRFAAAVRRMPRLDRLDLSSTRVTDAGLLQMACNPTLREIGISDCSQITGVCLPSLLHWPGLRELRFASDGIAEAVVLACPDPGHLERFTWTVTAAPSDRLINHFVAWPGMVQVTINGPLDKAVRQRLQEANERRSSVPPDLPGPAGGF